MQHQPEALASDFGDDQSCYLFNDISCQLDYLYLRCFYEIFLTLTLLCKCQKNFCTNVSVVTLCNLLDFRNKFCLHVLSVSQETTLM